ncbi:RrF2 family transcriptional regulator [Lichenihabitans psoromatis]|uniref:RrF2 family transcriptional regulator n=1 Tax=Lichenihabitans psoromatis TaxID=2528642 RepID=UPI0010369CB2|nr:Rrf2 family transcriptional regulator [Lichenihabitans psoromatis]
MLSRRTLFAIAAVLDTARLARSKPLPAKSLAARHDVAPRQFESLLQILVRADILKSLRGPHGGYELARERRRISLGDIARAIDTAKADPKIDSAPPSRLLGDVIKPTIADATAAFLDRLDQTTIEDLCRRADALGIDADETTMADFHI